MSPGQWFGKLTKYRQDRVSCVRVSSGVVRRNGRQSWNRLRLGELRRRRRYGYGLELRDPPLHILGDAVIKERRALIAQRDCNRRCIELLRFKAGRLVDRV